MLSEHLTTYARQRLDERRELLAPVIDAVDAEIASCEDPDEATLLAYLYATQPITDCLDVPVSLLRSFVRHALFLRREMPWTAELGEGMFVHYVLGPRINNESLVDCRPVFFEALRERVSDMSAYEAVREVNYWCAETATYQLTDDRTMNPLGVMTCGFGRCGEESTYLVTALRSIGIPARQIYAPWWSHCDDNHAWVEAYTGDAWHYLGACEPEEELDRGWFTNASGRALMEETTLFSDFTDDSVAGQGSGAVGSTCLQNVTHSYAIERPFEVRVTKDGAPAEGVNVMLEVLNMAEWSPMATLVTDATGTVRLDIGLGSVRVRAATDELMALADVNTQDTQLVELALTSPEDALAPRGVWVDVDVAAPHDHPAPSKSQTAEQDERARARKASCDAMRRTHTEALAAHARELACRWPGSEHAFACAWGNADELARFLEADDEADRLELLGTLTDKDFVDLSADMLESHLGCARALQADAEQRLRDQGLDEKAAHDAYVRYVLCPRTHLEHMSDWRPYISEFFDAELREAFVADPRRIWAWMGENLTFAEHEGLAKLVGTPEGALAGNQAAERTRTHTFVAICRTLGIAAQANPESGRPEFMEAGKFVPVQVDEVPATRRVSICCPEGSDAATYASVWTIGRMGVSSAANGNPVWGFSTLELGGCAFVDGKLALDLEDGTYRLITTSRLPNGNQQSRELTFVVSDASCGVVSSADGEMSVELSIRKPAASDMLNVIPLPAVALHDRQGGHASCALGAHKTGVVAFCQEGMEPTEHLLNEIRDRVEELRAAQLPITLVVRDEAALADPTMARTLAAMPEIAVAFDDFSELPERLARRTYANPELLPLTLLVTESEGGQGLTSLFSTAGYNVGTVDLLLRLANLARG